jgi:TldD protein
VYRGYGAVTGSSVELDVSQGTTYFVNTLGTMVRTPDMVAILRTRASCQAEDGMLLYDGGQWVAPEVGKLPPEAELVEGVRAVAERLTELTRAPIGQTYVGPVLFEPRAAAQLAGEILGTHLSASRRPVAEPGRALPFAGSEFEARINSRVMPEWLSVVDDPEQREWEGRVLAGHYEADLEGVRPRRLTVIDKGELKTLLTGRQPVRGVPGSNGRARLPGNFGVRMPRISNLFLEAERSEPLTELRTRLMSMASQQQKEYAMVVRKMDFPTAGTLDDLRRLGQRVARGGGGRAVSLPLAIYRVYADGREELVRGLRFRGMGPRAFRDIVAASAEREAYDYLDNGVPLAVPGAVPFVVGCSVVSPALLFEELELEAIEEEFPERPLAPPPGVTG